jgi:NADPH:quinone reductase-like Zn-dependent oxidoreductase
MNAAVIYENGDMDQIQVDDVPVPTAGPGEVVVEVRAAALIHLDIWVRRGRPGATLHPPHILGSDAAGVVAQVGEGVTAFTVGEAVVVNPGLSCGVCEYCQRGQHSECSHFTIVGLGGPGTFAERVAVPAANLQPKPAHLSFEEAAALPLAHLTAWRMVVSRAGVRPGEQVLIHGIGGGVALAALQLCKLAGASVIVTSSSDEKLARAVELGADFAINYATKDVAESVRQITKERGVDAVIDAVGAATWPINFQVLRKGGRVVHCGVTTGASAEVNLSALYWNQFTIMGSTMGSHEDFRQMLQAVSANKLWPVIDSVHVLEDVREATRRMEAGEQFGKIVLKVK